MRISLVRVVCVLCISLPLCRGRESSTCSSHKLTERALENYSESLAHHLALDSVEHRKWELIHKLKYLKWRECPGTHPDVRVGENGDSKRDVFSLLVRQMHVYRLARSRFHWKWARCESCWIGPCAGGPARTREGHKEKVYVWWASNRSWSKSHQQPAREDIFHRKENPLRDPTYLSFCHHWGH